MKVETWLKMAGFDYTTVPCMNPGQGPKKKIPFIRVDGRSIGDSELIIDHLRISAPNDPDHGETAEEAALTVATTRMLDEHLYWTIVYSRWIDDRYWPTIRAEFFKIIPGPFRGLIAAMIRRGVRKVLHGQGMGRHTADEIYAFAARDIDALAGLLGDKPYFLGGAPRRVDAVCYAYLAGCYHATLESPLTHMVTKHPSLAAYTDRMRDRYFPEKT